MFPVSPRESVILAENYESLVAWYRDTLDLKVVSRHDEGFHYTHLENPAGVRLGIAVAEEMNVEPRERSRNTVLMQFEVNDVRAFLAHIEVSGGSASFGPSFNREEGFWFGAFADPEGNPFWIVDRNCPE